MKPEKLNKRREFQRRKNWKANWIHNGVAGEGPHYVFFRKEIDVDTTVESAEMFVSADRKYKLYVDGEFIGEGPIRANTHYWSYDRYELASHLTPGKHVLAFVVSQWDPSMMKPLALIAELTMSAKDGTAELVATDSSWRCYTATGWRSDAPTIVWAGAVGTGYVEIRDLRPDAMDWQSGGFDDSCWQSVSLFRNILSGQEVKDIGRRWEYLLERDIPYFTYETIDPVDIAKVGEVKATEVSWGKHLVGDHLWIGLEDVRSLDHATVDGASGFLAGSELVMSVKYDGEHFGRIVWQPAVILDFGRIVNGYVQLDIEAAGGTIIDVSHEQTLQDGKVHPNTGAIRRVNRYVLKDGQQEIESFEYVNARYLQITVVESSRPVTVRSVHLKTTEYPVESTAEFECSDEVLTRVWSASEYTTHLCMNDLIMDNTWREKSGWGGDISMALLAALTCYGNPAIIKRTLRMFAYDQLPSGRYPVIVPLTPGDLFDHAMSYPIRLRDYHEYTGDRDLVEELYPSVRRYMEYLERYEEDDGTLGDVPGSIWFDWAVLDRRTPSAILNCFYYVILNAMTTVAAVLGLDEDAEIYGRKQERVKLGIEKFWDNERGVFPDCKAGDSFSPNTSETANGIALCNGLVDAERAGRIVDRVFSSGFDIHAENEAKKSAPPFSLYVLQGLCDAGYHMLALEYMRERHGSAFRQGLQTMPETWVFSSKGEVSAAQSSVAAGYTLTREILGIRPGEPGFGTLRIEPHPGDLQWARGTAVTPHGDVEVGWEVNAESFSVRAATPPGMNSVLVVADRGGAVLLDGQELEEGQYSRDEERRVTVQVEPGSHSVVVMDPGVPG